MIAVLALILTGVAFWLGVTVQQLRTELRVSKAAHDYALSGWNEATGLLALANKELQEAMPDALSWRMTVQYLTKDRSKPTQTARVH